MRWWVSLLGVGGVEEEFGLDPESDAVSASDPGGERNESAGVAGEPSEFAFDDAAHAIERFPERRLQQGDRAESTGSVRAVAQSGSRPLALCDELLAAMVGDGVQRITVEGFVSQDVAFARL